MFVVSRLSRGGMLSVMEHFWAQLGDLGLVEIVAHGPNSASVGPPVREVGGRFSGFLRFPAVCVYLTRLLLACLRAARGGDAVLLPQDSWATGAAAALAGRLSNTPVVVMEHGTASALRTEFFWKRRFPPSGMRDRLTRPLLIASVRILHRLCLGLLDAALLPSEEADELYASRGVPRAKRLRYHVPVDTQRFRPSTGDEKAELRRAAGLPEEGLLVGTVSRLAPEKAIEVLLDAVAAMSPSQRPAVVVAGEGRERTPLESHAASRGVEVRFLGAVPDEALPGLLRSLDVFASSSAQGSNVPVATLEAMACGLAVVATDAPIAHVAMLAEGRGTVVRAGDVSGFTDGLARYLADPALRERSGAAARAWVAEHHAPAVLRREIDELVTWLDARDRDVRA